MQYFPMVQFIMLYKVVLTFEFVDEKGFIPLNMYMSSSLQLHLKVEPQDTLIDAD